MGKAGPADEAARIDPSESTDGAEEPEEGPSKPIAQRLHPLSPVLKGVKAMWVIIAAISWQGFARFGVSIGAMIVIIAAVLGLAWSWISWYYTGFVVADGRLRIAEGALFRRHRTIPLERLQSVEVVQPLLARPFGLAEVRCEVVGAAKTEAPLAYLPLEEAHELRRRLIALSKHPDAVDEEPSAAPVDVSGEDASGTRAVLAPLLTEPDGPTGFDAEPIVTVSPRRLVASKVLSPEVLFIPIAVGATVGFFVWQPDMSFFGLAGLVTATAGILLRPVRAAFADYGFRLGVTDAGLRTSRGLTERRNHTLPVERVTAVTVARPFLWRSRRWQLVRAANAGGVGPQSSSPTGATLLPVGTPSQARRIARLALSGADLFAVPPIPAPRAARWLAPFGKPGLGVALTDELFVSCKGRITPTVTAVPYARIQSIRVVQGRLQRVLGLATVRLDVAGAMFTHTSAEHRTVTEALRLASELRARNRSAARAEHERAR